MLPSGPTLQLETDQAAVSPDAGPAQRNPRFLWTGFGFAAALTVMCISAYALLPLSPHASAKQEVAFNPFIPAFPGLERPAASGQSASNPTASLPKSGQSRYTVQPRSKRGRKSTKMMAAVGEAPNVKVGDKVPDVTFDSDFPPQKVKLRDLTKGKRVVLVGLPGAFTPT